jgi:NitT/TauT family transport system permease protein
MAELSLEQKKYLSAKKRKQMFNNLSANYPWMFPVISLSIFCITWELVIRLNFIDARFVAAPTMIVAALIDYATSGTLLIDLKESLIRILLGFVVGAVPGIIVGLIMGLSPVIRAFLNPIVSVLYPLPKSAILPIMILILGMGNLSKIIFLAFSVFFLVLMNTITGVLSINPIYLDVAKNFGASKWDYYFRIALPSALPMVFTGMKLGLGLALVLIVLAEFVGAKEGIGFLIWNSWQIFDISSMYVGLLVIAILGYIMSAILDFIEKLLIPWKVDKK